MGELFDVKEEQVQLDSSNKKTTIATVSGLDRDKRSLLWFLQSKVGKKYEAHWAADFATAAARANCVDAIKRKRELDDFEAERAQALQRREESIKGTPSILQTRKTSGINQSSAMSRLGIRIKKP